MENQFGISRMIIVLLVLVVLSGCAPSGTPAVTSSPAVPTAPPAATATAASTPVPEPTATTVQPTATLPPTVATEESARYRLTFETTWSAATHPTDFPPNPHFSGLIGAAHRAGVRLWGEGETATPGMENMAETGEKSPLDGEIEALIADGGVCEMISGGGIALSPGEVTVEFTVSQDCPLVSVVSMIAPSPDWFVGVAGLSLLGDRGWIEEQVVDLYPYDAGTDNGGSYTSPDEPAAVREVIFILETDPFLVGGRVPPLGVFRFTRLHE